MEDFDITGFVRFPENNLDVIKSQSCSTLVYLLAMDFDDNSSSNVLLDVNPIFWGDDISPKLDLPNTYTFTQEHIVSVLRNHSIDRIDISKKVISSVLLGWSKFSYDFKTEFYPWICNFKDLTGEGKNLYYSFKKLHNEKEVRILTIKTEKNFSV